MTSSDEPPVVHVDDRRAAEANAVAWLRYWGYTDAAVRTAGGATGPAVAGSKVLGDVSAAAARVGRPALQRLVAACESDRQMVFFSKGGYTVPAVAYADERDIALFTYDLRGRMRPLNASAERVATAAGAVSVAAAAGTGRPSRWARFRQRPLVTQVVSGVLATLLAAAVLTGIGWAYKGVTAPSDAETARDSLSRLTVGMSVERFRDKLGTPYATRQVDAGPRGWTENLWLTKLYAAQTLSDGSGSVALYSMTTRDKSLALRDPRFGVALGRAHFTNYPFSLDSGVPVTSWKGPGADWFYSEAHGLGAPGFETIVLTASSSGDAAGYAKTGFPTDFPYILCKRPLCSPPSNVIKDLSRLRSRLLVTTYTVLDEDRLPLKNLPGEFRFGPDRDTVRGFVDTSSRDS